MKKTLLTTTAAALFILSLAGCAGTTEPVQTEDRPQITAEPTAAVESAPVLFSAGNELPVEDSADGAEDSAASEEPTASPEPDTLALTTTPAPQVAALAPEETPASAPATPAPQETPAPAKAVIKFDVTTQKGTGESPSPEPSATPKPEPTPTPAPTPAPPVESTAPAFNINQWITYAQSYAKGAGLNLDPTATACWDRVTQMTVFLRNRWWLFVKISRIAPVRMGSGRENVVTPSGYLTPIISPRSRILMA